MAIQLDFSSAEAQRLRITQQQQEYIRDLYKQASAEVGKLAEKAPRVPSDSLRQQYLHTLQGQIDEQLRDIESQLNGVIRSSMTDTVKATVADAKSFLKENGLPIKGAYSHVPADIVRSVASGQLYRGNWTLSRALWLNTTETQHDVQSVIAQGIIQNKSAYDIAKDLEKYVDPSARKDWDWSKVYPGTRKVVDYNAQRLARTMVSHTYQQAFVRMTRHNPFVSKYKWEASNSERTCEICEERNGQLFEKDALPLDHPNGMCTFTAILSEDNLDKIGERLGDWAAGKADPELDKWAEDLYGKGWEQKKEEVKPYGVTGKDITDTWQRRSDQFGFEIEDVINAQGFDGLPRVVSREEFDAAVRAANGGNGFIAQRTYSASSQQVLESYRDQLYNGKWYVDCSVGGSQYGQGMYCSSDYFGVLTDGIKTEMDAYLGISRGKGNGFGYIETITLDPSARIITFSEAKSRFLNYQAQMFEKIRLGEIDAEYAMKNTIRDVGSFSAAIGYDAINVEGAGNSGSYTVILNRTKVIFLGA